MPEDGYLGNPLAIIGGEDTVMGFRAVGFKVYPVRDLAGCVNALKEAANDKAAVCLVQDDFYDLAKEQIRGYKGRPLSVFIPFGREKGPAILDEAVKKIRLKATGAF